MLSTMQITDERQQRRGIQEGLLRINEAQSGSHFSSTISLSLGGHYSPYQAHVYVVNDGGQPEPSEVKSLPSNNEEEEPLKYH